MNDEIKEILDMFTKYKDDWYSCEYKLKPKQCATLLDYITNLQQELKEANESIEWWTNRFKAMQKENERLKDGLETMTFTAKVKQEAIDALIKRFDKAIDYLTCYESISKIQGLDDIEKNKELDEKTMNIMVERYLKVHHKLLNILQGDDNNEENRTKTE